VVGVGHQQVQQAGFARRQRDTATVQFGLLRRRIQPEGTGADRAPHGWCRRLRGHRTDHVQHPDRLRDVDADADVERRIGEVFRQPGRLSGRADHEKQQAIRHPLSRSDP
jgi:hypothetical protein